MPTAVNLQEEVNIQEMNCTIPSEITYFHNKTGKVKGAKTLRKDGKVFLVEFNNYNRVWMLPKELKSTGVANIQLIQLI